MRDYKKIAKVAFVVALQVGLFAALALQALKIKEYQNTLVHYEDVKAQNAECRNEYVKLYFYTMQVAEQLQRCNMK